MNLHYYCVSEAICILAGTWAACLQTSRMLLCFEGDTTLQRLCIGLIFSGRKPLLDYTGSDGST